jgi:hypothetical protein
VKPVFIKHPGSNYNKNMEGQTETQTMAKPVEVASQEKQNNDFEYPNEYRERIRFTHSELERIIQQGEENINLGPTYHLQTSKGEPLMVDSLSVDYKDKYGGAHRKYYLVAQDLSGKIVGDRTTDVRELEFKGDKYARGEGMTATGKRGGNVSSTIEAVHQDILQREAQRIGKRVDWHVSNSNMEKLQDLQEDFRLNPSENLKAQIDNKIAEQRRWQAVYGVGGKLGFNDSGTKSFSPEDSARKYEPANSSLDLPPTDPDLYKQSRKEVLDRVMSRMKEISSKT